MGICIGFLSHLKKYESHTGKDIGKGEDMGLPRGLRTRRVAPEEAGGTWRREENEREVMNGIR